MDDQPDNRPCFVCGCRVTSADPAETRCSICRYEPDNFRDRAADVWAAVQGVAKARCEG